MIIKSYIVLLSVIILFRLSVVFSFGELFTKQLTDKRSEDTFASYSYVRSAAECGTFCAKNAGCFGYSFCSSSGTCHLSSDWMDFYRTESESDCKIYKRGSAFNTNDVICLDGLNITVHQGPASKSEATDACDDQGRLLQLPTVAIFRAVEGLLLSLDVTFTNLWTDGEYDSDSGTWQFSDGSPMPNSADPSIMVNDEANPTCVRLKLDGGRYVWHDKHCEANFGYICEQVSSD